jgi:hypothetical protein
MLFHQGLSLFFDRGGLYRLAAFDSHRGLDSLGDFLVQAGADLHRFLPSQTAGTAGIVGVNYSSSGQSKLVEPRLHLSTSLSSQRPSHHLLHILRQAFGRCHFLQRTPHLFFKRGLVFFPVIQRAYQTRGHLRIELVQRDHLFRPELIAAAIRRMEL